MSDNERGKGGPRSGPPRITMTIVYSRQTLTGHWVFTNRGVGPNTCKASLIEHAGWTVRKTRTEVSGRGATPFYRPEIDPSPPRRRKYFLK